MKLQQLPNKQFFLTLPCKLVRAKGWQKGDYIYVNLDRNGDMLLRKVKEGEGIPEIEALQSI